MKHSETFVPLKDKEKFDLCPKGKKTYINGVWKEAFKVASFVTDFELFECSPNESSEILRRP